MTKAILRSPIGPIMLRCDGTHLVSVDLLARDREESIAPCEAPPGSIAAEAVRQLGAYFADGHSAFDLPLAPLQSERGSALRDAIAAIPPGEMLSYGALALRAGSGPRAIGQACARNRFPIIIACHRVIGSGGAIGHYSAGGGVATKIWLLDHERRGGLL